MFQVDIKKFFYLNLLKSFSTQIKLHPTRWQYPLINYLGYGQTQCLLLFEHCLCLGLSWWWQLCHNVQFETVFPHRYIVGSFEQWPFSCDHVHLEQNKNPNLVNLIGVKIYRKRMLGPNLGQKLSQPDSKRMLGLKLDENLQETQITLTGNDC